MNTYKPGQNVKINPFVYDYQWEGYKELWRKFWHHNLIVDNIIDLSDVGEGEWIVVNYLGTKAKVKPSYLLDT